MNSYLKICSIALLLTGCAHHSNDRCQEVFDKMKPVLQQIAVSAGKPVGDYKAMLDKCHSDPKMLNDKMSVCVLAAKDQAAIADCVHASVSDYAASSKAIEAKVELTMLGKDLKVAYLTDATFPVGSAPLTPSTACCAQPDHKCAPVEADWSSAVWKALDFSVTEPSRFQYSYDSDGKTATVKAVGDLACDGHPVEFVGHASVDASGNPVFELSDNAK